MDHLKFEDEEVNRLRMKRSTVNKGGIRSVKSPMMKIKKPLTANEQVGFTQLKGQAQMHINTW